MRVVALLSGGKDSVYCAVRARELGHEVVAVANLHPPGGAAGEPPPQELDSFTFQTVGHQAVAGIAACMGVPLFRRAIRGTSVNQDLQYRRSDGDEVEDLRALLAVVQRALPGGVDAVCSGAIRSDYQRTRVEAVCADLGLVSLAFLWRRPQPQLLEEMVEGGMVCALVKVAALGLDPQKHLGKTLGQLQSHLERLYTSFGCHMCGEGGEYETLTLDAPIFSRGRLIVDSATVEAEKGTGVGHWNITALHVEAKELEGAAPLPEVIQTEAEGQTEEIDAGPLRTDAGKGNFSDGVGTCDVVVRCEGGEKYLLLSGRAMSSENTAEASQAAAQALLSRFHDLLQERGLSWVHCVTVHLYLKDMEHFAAVNATYCSLIPMIRPPSRCCVELPLGCDTPLVLDVLVTRGSTDPEWKDVLHVQSISQWAPSCIGPYSQASRHGPFHFLAGQIGLVPETMELKEGGWETELPLALASCESVARAVGSSLLDYSLGLTVFHSTRAEFRGPKGSVSDMENVMRGFLSDALGMEEDTFGENEYRRRHGGPPAAPVLYVQVPFLPKDASVEVQPFLYAPLPSEATSEESPVMAGSATEPSRGWYCDAKFLPGAESNAEARNTVGSTGVLRCEGAFGSSCSGTKHADMSGACHELAGVAAGTISAAGLEWRNTMFCRVYHVAPLGSSEELRSELQRAFSAQGAPGPIPLQVVPASTLALGRDEGLTALMQLAAVF